MIGGFALIAYPAEYGNSGVMTFLVNHAGAVYQKDLGDYTMKRVQAHELVRSGPDLEKGGCEHPVKCASRRWRTSFGVGCFVKPIAQARSVMD